VSPARRRASRIRSAPRTHASLVDPTCCVLKTLICYTTSHSLTHRMADSRTRRKGRSSPNGLGSNQLTLDDWADIQKATRERREGDRRGRKDGVHPEVVVAKPSDEARVPNMPIGDEESARKHPPATGLLARPEALLSRSDLRELGLGRRAVDAVFRALPVVAFPGYARPLVRVEDYRELVERNTFRDDRVRPGTRAASGC
jgi:hypothetical protein